jgi:hypothetical protein
MISEQRATGSKGATCPQVCSSEKAEQGVGSIRPEPASCLWS